MPAERVRLRPQVILLGLVSLLNDASSEMIAPLLPVFLVTTLGATPFIVGLIEGAADGLASILKLFAGSWSDRMPRRKPLVVAGYGLAAVSRVLIGWAGRWPSILAARLIDRTGKGIRSAPRDALIAEVTPPESRGRAFGFHRALDHTGAIAGPLMAVALMQGLNVPIRTMFFVAIVPATIGVILLIALLREEPKTSRAASAATGKGAAPLPARLWHALAAISLFSLANSSDAFLILQAHAAGVATAMLPLLWAAHHVIKAVFSTRAGALSDRIDRRYLLIVGWCFYAAIYFIFPAVHSMRAFFVLAGTALFGLLYERVSPRFAFHTGAALALAAVVVVAIRVVVEKGQSARG
ncbi:MAG TPA: MFS transporter [Thermoanaerobaculia bacterium]|nr:MFS transporter [Thermoanaerobaculia bacterium]